MKEHNMNITLWGMKQSPFVQKVMIALDELTLDYQHIPALPTRFINHEPLNHIQQQLADISPCGRVPVLQIDGYTVIESSIIIMHLATRQHAKTAFYPTSLGAYSQALWLERFADYDLAQVITRRIAFETFAKPRISKIAVDKARIEEICSTQLPPLLNYLTKQLKGHTFIETDQLSAADIAITTQLLILRQCHIDISSTHPDLNHYLNRQLERPSIQPLIDIQSSGF